MRNFRELEIWQDAVDYVVMIYDQAKLFPQDEKYILTRQIKRSAVCIPSNIAEGCRGSNKELNQFLNIAIGSSFELETQLEIAHRLGYLDQDDWKLLMGKLEILQKRMNAFRSSVKNS